MSSGATTDLRSHSNPRLETRGHLRSTADLAGGIRRMHRAFGVRLADGDPADLRFLREFEQSLRAMWPAAIAGMRAAGFSDGEIGAAIGVTGQAVNKRWPRDAGSAT